MLSIPYVKLLPIFSENESSDYLHERKWRSKIIESKRMLILSTIEAALAQKGGWHVGLDWNHNSNVPVCLIGALFALRICSIYETFV
jgi:hypothetical protein